LYTVFTGGNDGKKRETLVEVKGGLNSETGADNANAVDPELLQQANMLQNELMQKKAKIMGDTVKLPQRYKKKEDRDEPYPLEEVEKNMTLYLHTLHSRLGALAGPEVDAEIVWETFLDVTKSMPMVWDEENKHRFPKPRDDDSIFVSLGTYRDPYCPMTLKSLYHMAKNPERLFVGLFQQNCFEKKCRTGVLKGGIVEDMGSDVDCYKEFCKSPEGQQSNACNTGQIRLFTVNESESLGPYLARYLGGKLYRGEQYYLQIDSHSEFVQNWDAKLIKMVEDAPAKKPVISTYPPDRYALFLICFFNCHI